MLINKVNKLDVSCRDFCHSGQTDDAHTKRSKG